MIGAIRYDIPWVSAAGASWVAVASVVAAPAPAAAASSGFCSAAWALFLSPFFLLKIDLRLSLIFLKVFGALRSS